MTTDTLLSLFFVQTMLEDSGEKQRDKENSKSTYIVELGLVTGLLGFIYVVLKLLSLSTVSFTNLLSILTLPLHWELSYITTDNTILKWYVIGSSVSMLALSLLKLCAAMAEKSLLNFRSENAFLLSIGNSTYLLLLLVKLWCRLLLPLLYIKGFLFGILWLLSMVVGR
ncbi:hypothetical protein ACMGD3_23860 [Lysinibacillus sphaericus]|uniref:hypothetical protein n=1 Tax=Lysinibacillus sphaericus TaxID=1421 RepID=UPI003F7925B6